MKDIIKKSKIKSTSLPCKLTINKVDVYNKSPIAGQKLASQIPKSCKAFETNSKVNIIMDSKPLSMKELKDAFFLLKINKSPDVDDNSFNIIKNCFRVLSEPLMYLFQLSFKRKYFQMI